MNPSAAHAPRPDFASLEAAAQWFATLDDLAGQPPDALQRFRQWLEQDPRHRAAWACVQAVNADFARVAGPAAPAAQAALRAPGLQRRRALGTLAVLGTVGLGGWLGLRSTAWPDAQTVAAQAHTGTGQVRSLALADGGRAWLNADTRIAIANSSGLRRITLLAGEIFVASGHGGHAPARPLVVETAAGQVQPLGTRFSVRQQADAGTEVAVYEGAVRLTPRQGAPTTLAAGEQARFSALAVEAPAPAAAARQAWIDGLLIADHMRLDLFLQELSHHRPGHLGCDPAVAGLRIDGVFPLADTDQVLAMLEQSLPVAVRRTTPWWTSVGPRR